MKTLSIITIFLVAVGIAAIPELMSLHWFTYLLSLPAAGFTSMVLWFISTVVFDL